MRAWCPAVGRADIRAARCTINNVHNQQQPHSRQADARERQSQSRRRRDRTLIEARTDCTAHAGSARFETHVVARATPCARCTRTTLPPRRPNPTPLVCYISRMVTALETQHAPNTRAAPCKHAARVRQQARRRRARTMSTARRGLTARAAQRMLGTRVRKRASSQVFGCMRGITAAAAQRFAELCFSREERGKRACAARTYMHQEEAGGRQP